MFLSISFSCQSRKENGIQKDGENARRTQMVVGEGSRGRGGMQDRHER